MLDLPPLDDGTAAGESGYSVRWFEEDNPTVFDQVWYHCLEQSETSNIHIVVLLF